MVETCCLFLFHDREKTHLNVHRITVFFFYFFFFLMQLHGEMCKRLSAIYCKVTSIFPSLEAARPGSKSGIQALCSLHIALEKAKNVLQHCSTCSKLYLVRVSLCCVHTLVEEMYMHNCVYVLVCILKSNGFDFYLMHSLNDF